MWFLFVGVVGLLDRFRFDVEGYLDIDVDDRGI